MEGKVVAVPAAVGYSEETEPDVEKRKTAAEEGRILTDAAGEALADVTTGTADWKVYLDDSFYLVAEPFISDNLGASIEHLDFARVRRAGRRLPLTTAPGGKRMPSSLWSGAILRRMWVCIWIFT